MGNVLYEFLPGRTITPYVGAGVPTNYLAATLGWQHWFSPQFQIRPEISYWYADGGTPFNGGTKRDMFMFAMDATIHF